MIETLRSGETVCKSLTYCFKKGYLSNTNGKDFSLKMFDEYFKSVYKDTDIHSLKYQLIRFTDHTRPQETQSVNPKYWEENSENMPDGVNMLLRLERGKNIITPELQKEQVKSVKLKAVSEKEVESEPEIDLTPHDKIPPNYLVIERKLISKAVSCMNQFYRELFSYIYFQFNCPVGERAEKLWNKFDMFTRKNKSYHKREMLTAIRTNIMHIEERPGRKRVTTKSGYTVT